MPAHGPREWQTGWSDERRAAYVAENTRRKSLAQKFFQPGKFFTVEIYEMRAGKQRSFFKRSFVQQSDYAEFWEKVTAALKKIFTQIPPESKNFQNVPINIFLGKQNLYRHNPPTLNSHEIVLYVVFSGADAPIPL